MGSQVSALRDALDQFYAGVALARLRRDRDPSDDDPAPGGAAAAWLTSNAGRDAFGEARESGALDPNELDWLRRQLDNVRYTASMLSAAARTRSALARASLPSGEPLELAAQLAQLARADDDRRRAELARDLEHVLRPIALELANASARAEQPLHVARAPKPASLAPPAASSGGLLIVSAYSVEAMLPQAPRDLPLEPWLDEARAFLAQTDAAAEDAVQRCLRGLRTRRPIDWHVLLRGLRAPELDSERGARERWRRAAAWLAPLGFERELAVRLRTENARGAYLPVASVYAPRIPHDVRLAQLATNYGVASDVFAAQAVAHGLGLALAHPALPSELRWPCGAHVSGVLGALALQLFGERVHLERVQGLSNSEAERVGRLAATIALLDARAWIALAACELATADRAETRLEAIASALSRALCCELPPPIAGLTLNDRVLARGFAQERLAGFALHAALRERFDTDFYRNPRSGELLRSLCARGNSLRPEALCEELGTSFAGAAGRANELAR